MPEVTLSKARQLGPSSRFCGLVAWFSAQREAPVLKCAEWERYLAMLALWNAPPDFTVVQGDKSLKPKKKYKIILGD